MKKRFWVTVLVAFLLAAGGGARAASVSSVRQHGKADQDIVVAVVEGRKIMLSDVKRLHEEIPQLSALPLEVIYDNLLSYLIKTQVLALAAKKEGLEKRPDVKRRLTEVEDQVLAQTYTSAKIEELLTKKKMEELYRKYLKDSPPGEEIRARHILVSTEKEGIDVINRLNAGADFVEIANSSTKDTTTDGGDLGYFTKDNMIAEISEAAFRMKKGEISQKPIETIYGWHVIKVEDRRALTPPSLDKVESLLREQFTASVSESISSNLVQRANIKRYGMDGKAVIQPRGGSKQPLSQSYVPEYSPDDPPESEMIENPP